MLDLIRDAISALQIEASSYSPAVRIWMRVMMFSFLFGLAFCWHKAAARAVVIVTLMIMTGLIASKIVVPDISRSIAGAILHIILWIPLLIWIWRTPQRPSWNVAKSVFERSYFIWILWVTILIALSLIMDVMSLV